MIKLLMIKEMSYQILGSQFTNRNYYEIRKNVNHELPKSSNSSIQISVNYKEGNILELN